MSPIEMLTFRLCGGGKEYSGGIGVEEVRGDTGDRFCDLILND